MEKCLLPVSVYFARVFRGYSCPFSCGFAWLCGANFFVVKPPPYFGDFSHVRGSKLEVGSSKLSASSAVKIHRFLILSRPASSQFATTFVRVVLRGILQSQQRDCASKGCEWCQSGRTELPWVNAKRKFNPNRGLCPTGINLITYSVHLSDSIFLTTSLRKNPVQQQIDDHPRHRYIHP